MGVKEIIDFQYFIFHLHSIVCLPGRFMQFSFSSYETSPEIYSLEAKVV